MRVQLTVREAKELNVYEKLKELDVHQDTFYDSFPNYLFTVGISDANDLGLLDKAYQILNAKPVTVVDDPRRHATPLFMGVKK